MGRYIEYEIDTGHIISELTSTTAPAAQDNIGYLELNSDAEIDLSGYKVKGGSLVKDYETNEERIERERIKREQAEKVRLRIKSMTYELCFAILDDNEDEIKSLKEEFRRMKVYL